MRTIDFDRYSFRASQSSKLAVGTIGLTDLQRAELDGYVDRYNGNGRPLTSKQIEKMKELEDKSINKELPKTIQTELRKIYRAEIFNRNFVFTNKFVQKGIQQEEEAISVYQDYRKEKGINGLLLKNKVRLYGEYFNGEPDLFDNIKRENWTEGFDIKCSWSFDTFPMRGDELDFEYECQNMVYMYLTGLKKWTTAHVLVNITEDGLQREKEKWFYALKLKGMFPDDEQSPNYDEYITKCSELERMLIFDYDRFVDINPYHQMTISREQWFADGNEIPLSERVVENVTLFDEEKMDFLIERAKISREYLKKLNTL